MWLYFLFYILFGFITVRYFPHKEHLILIEDKLFFDPAGDLKITTPDMDLNVYYGYKFCFWWFAWLFLIGVLIIAVLTHIWHIKYYTKKFLSFIGSRIRPDNQISQTT